MNLFLPQLGGMVQLTVPTGAARRDTSLIRQKCHKANMMRSYHKRLASTVFRTALKGFIFCIMLFVCFCSGIGGSLQQEPVAR